MRIYCRTTNLPGNDHNGRLALPLSPVKSYPSLYIPTTLEITTSTTESFSACTLFVIIIFVSMYL
jgi:hypothetical protein